MSNKITLFAIVVLFGLGTVFALVVSNQSEKSNTLTPVQNTTESEMVNSSENRAPLTTARLHDVTLESGVTHSRSSTTLMIQIMSGGVAIADVNNDGLEDLYFTNENHDELYLNKGDLKFENVTEQWDVPENRDGTGSLLADFNSDGLVDLFAYNWGSENMLFFNKGDHFQESRRQTPLYNTMLSFGASAADIDRDGDLDLVVINYEDMDNHDPSIQNGVDNQNSQQDFVFLNDGTGYFESAPFEIDTGTRWGLASAFLDVNNDMWQDLFIANDFGWDQVYINENGTLQQKTEQYLEEEIRHGMSATVGDYDNDGFLDIFVSNIWVPDIFEHDGGNLLLHNEQGRTFSNKADEVGIAQSGWAWGAAFLDIDNDGDLDLIQAAGDIDPTQNFDHERSYVFIQHDGSFSEQGEHVGVDMHKQGKGLAIADLDQDGQMDVVINNSRDIPTIYRNDGSEGNWIGFELESPLLPAAGARVEIVSGDTRYIREVRVGSSYLSQHSSRVHFGLGAIQSVDSVTVRWPDGSQRTIADPTVNRYNTIVQE